MFLLAVIHQTTTTPVTGRTSTVCFYWRLYIKPQRISTHIAPQVLCFYWRLYIKPQRNTRNARDHSCVSIGGYTSNHNGGPVVRYTAHVFLLAVIHQTTTLPRSCFARTAVFLLAVIHQTTTNTQAILHIFLCFYWRLYIKPQLLD